MHSTKQHDFCKLCRSPGHSDFQASVTRSVGKILAEEAEAALNLLDALAIRDFEESLGARKKKEEKRNGFDDDVIMKDLEIPESEEVKKIPEAAVERIQRKAAIPCPSESSNPPVGLGITIPATLLTLTPEIHSRIFDILKNNRVSSLCLGLTCKTFYPLHWSRHGKLSIHNLHSPPSGPPPDISPDAYMTQLFDSAEMMHCINHFFPKNNFFSFTISERVTLDRRIELRDMRVKRKLENVKRLKAVEDKEVSLSTIWKETYGVGFLEDDSDDDIEACRKWVDEDSGKYCRLC